MVFVIYLMVYYFVYTSSSSLVCDVLMSGNAVMEFLAPMILCFSTVCLGVEVVLTALCVSVTGSR